MNKALFDRNTEKLAEEFPSLFENTQCFCHLPIGWIPRVRQLLSDLSEYANTNNVVIEIAQIKDKLGTFRCYLNPYKDSNIDQMLQKAYKDILSICEVCGSDNAKSTVVKTISGPSNWIYNLCPSCIEKRIEML